METDKLVECIIHYVGMEPGIKAVALVLKVIAHVNPHLFNEEEYHHALSLAIKSKRIIELEYIDPNMEYRVKSMFFIRGTKFTNLEELRDSQSVSG